MPRTRRQTQQGSPDLGSASDPYRRPPFAGSGTLIWFNPNFPRDHKSDGVRLTLILLAPWLGVAQPLKGEVKSSDIRLATEQVLAAEIKSDQPGCVAGTSAGGERTYASRGLASVELAVPITQDTVFDIASNSKQFTAALIYQSAAQGKIRLEQPVGHYLNGLTPPVASVTLRELLYHTSGIRDVDSLRMLTRTEDEPTPVTDDVIGAIENQKTLNFRPGSDFAYSNSNYILLARVLEVVEGKPLHELLAERIFDPLRMTSTTQRQDYAAVIAHHATAYQGTEQPRLQPSNWTIIGTSSIHSTAPDLLSWLEASSAPKGAFSFLEKLRLTGQLSNGETTAYAAGMVRDTYLGLTRFTHNGGSGGFRSTLAYYPDRSVAIAVLCNSSAYFPNLIADRLADRIFGARPAPATLRNRMIFAERSYYDPKADVFRWVSGTNEGVLVKSSPRDPGRLFRPGAAGYFTDQFGNRLSIRARHIKLDDGLRFQRRLDPMPTRTTAPGEVMTGRYASDELEVRISVDRDSEGYYLQIEPSEVFMRASDTLAVRMTPAVDGAYVTANGWVIRFPAPGQMTLSMARLVRYPLHHVSR